MCDPVRWIIYWKPWILLLLWQTDGIPRSIALSLVGTSCHIVPRFDDRGKICSKLFVFAARTVRFVVIHVSGEKHPSEIDDDSSGDDASNNDNSGGGGAGPECEEDASTTSREENEGGVHSEAAEERVGAGDRHGGGGGYDGGDEGRGCGRGGGGRWEPGFLEAELREACVRQLEIPVQNVRMLQKIYTAWHFGRYSACGGGRVYLDIETKFGLN